MIDDKFFYFLYKDDGNPYQSSECGLSTRAGSLGLRSTGSAQLDVQSVDSQLNLKIRIFILLIGKEVDIHATIRNRIGGTK